MLRARRAINSCWPRVAQWRAWLDQARPPSLIEPCISQNRISAPLASSACGANSLTRVAANAAEGRRLIFKLLSVEVRATPIYGCFFLTQWHIFCFTHGCLRWCSARYNALLRHDGPLLPVRLSKELIVGGDL